MARIRSIHHELALDDRLAACSWPARMAIALLPTIADREGRLRDDPKQIRAQVLPYDDGVDMNAVLDELAAVARLTRYSVDGDRYLQLARWETDQRPHMKECKSTIPAPTKDEAEHQP